MNANADADQESTDPFGLDPEAETVTDAAEGQFIYTSWGYGQTNVELAKIVDVSDTGKTVLARLVRPEVTDRAKGSESLRPTGEEYGEEFRLHVRAYGDDVSFRGSYPFIQGDPEKGTRMGSFGPFGNVAGGSVHQTATGYGH